MEFHPIRAFFSFLCTFVVYQLFIRPLPAGAAFSVEMWVKLGWTFLDSLLFGIIFSYGKAFSSVQDFTSQAVISFLYAVFVIFGVYGSIMGFLQLTMGIDQMDWFSAFWAQFLAIIISACLVWLIIRIIGWSAGVQAGDAAANVGHRVAKGHHGGGKHK